MLHRNYRSSGKAPAAGVVLFVVLGLLCCTILEAVYVYLMGFLTNLFLRLLTLCAVLVLSGMSLTLGMRLGKLRNPRLVRILSASILAISYYAGRCVYVSMAQSFFTSGSAEVLSSVLNLEVPYNSWIRLIFAPWTLIKALGNILPYGLISVNGFAIKGVLLLLIWIIECALLILVPFFIAAYYASRPYDEDLEVWYFKKEEWPVTYVPNYREVRSQMRRGNCAALLSALEEVKGYHMKGQESYAIIEFYMHGEFVGPYITLTNVKAVQSGPRKLDHYLVNLCHLFNVGTAEAKKLHDMVVSTYETEGKKKKSGDEQKLSDKISMAQFNVSRAGVKVASEIRRAGNEKDRQYEVRPSVPSETMEIPTLEDVSVHVPRVTPEMEKEYISKKNQKK